MRMVDVIAHKRDGGELSGEEITWFIREYTAGAIPDYQASALLMAVYLRGMNRRETVDLTLAMAHSGEMLDLHDVAPHIVDKHSSGGVGDKTSLVVLPLVAACGVPVGKMSGRGLGSSGGTLDKMESFRGWSSQLTLEQFKRQLAEIGLVLAGQTAALAPADGKLYALRDVTATVDNRALIAASIMSKKLAAGADAIVLDVKMGSGAFMPTVEAATDLAQLMVEIGQDAGRQTVALISDMNQPLGHAVGNALEVKEAIETLRGGGPADFWEHCQTVAAHMVRLAGAAATLDEACRLVSAARADGRGLAKFRQLIVAQGGDGRQVDDLSLLPTARYVEPLEATRSGYVAAMDTAELGWVCVRCGGGRLVKSDEVDPAVGFLLPIKIGDYVEAGQEIGVIHANDDMTLQQAQRDVPAAITVVDHPVPPRPLFYATIGNE
ncbi:thymidine phosphorylase [Promineifilum sp.]|uniref:thymidine phosphorylase n=1 Tax=Promineifilum sp. TaxID=2664178 RepID=UPI0035AE2140